MDVDSVIYVATYKKMTSEQFWQSILTKAKEAGWTEAAGGADRRTFTRSDQFGREEVRVVYLPTKSKAVIGWVQIDHRRKGDTTDPEGEFATSELWPRYDEIVEEYED